MPERVVITGMGWVTPLGVEVDAVWQRLLEGTCAIGPVSRFEGESFRTNFAAQVPDFDPMREVEDWAAHDSAGLNTQFALAAAQRAWAQSGLADADLVASRFGQYMGSGEGSLDFENFVASNLAGWDESSRTVDGARWSDAARVKLDIVREVEQEPHMLLAHLAKAFGCRGPAFNCMTACAASTQAVGEAYHLIRRGSVDVMFAGGSHTMIHPLGMTGFIRLTAMSTRRDDPTTAARPFSRSRDGFVMGEGAGMLILESESHAKARGADILAEVAGFGSSADAYRITDIQPEGLGAAAAMEQAVKQAGFRPTERDAKGRAPVQYISAHGTGTQENDAIETKAVKHVFGDLAREIPFSSVKSMIGHLIQAAGAVELMTCVQAIRTGWVPPTINLHDPDPECDLDHVPNEARRADVDVCLSNGFGFGGQNDCLCVRRYVG